MRTPRTDEYSIGVDREIGRRLAVAIAYVRKDGSNFIGWTDVGGQYREETRPLPDGRSLPVFVLVERHGRSPLSVDESDGILADVQRSRDGRRKAPVRTAGRRSARTRCRGPRGCRCRAGRPPRARRSARSPARRTSRSGRIRTASPTRAAGCQRSTAHVPGHGQRRRARGPASWSPPTCSTSAASRGRRRRRSRCRRAISASCSSRAARAGSRRKRCSICACRGRFAFGGEARRAARGRAQCAQRHGGGGPGHRQSVQPEFRSGHRLHGSASRDDRREAEPGRQLIARTAVTRSPCDFVYLS